MQTQFPVEYVLKTQENLKVVVSLFVEHDADTLLALRPTQAQCEQVEYSRIGLGHIGVHIGHVNFILFVFCFLALGSQCKYSLWW